MKDGLYSSCITVAHRAALIIPLTKINGNLKMISLHATSNILAIKGLFLI